VLYSALLLTLASLAVVLVLQTGSWAIDVARLQAEKIHLNKELGDMRKARDELDAQNKKLEPSSARRPTCPGSNGLSAWTT